MKTLYIIRFANLNGSNEQTITIPKDTSINFVCISFDKGIVDVEPNKNTWDLQFGKYTTLLYTEAGEPYPYLLTGVLLNPYKTTAALDTIDQFDDVTFNIAEQQNLVNQKDIIGWDWKEYSFDYEIYTVDPEKIYIVKTSFGYYYKLRFIDFYNSKGRKRIPDF